MGITRNAVRPYLLWLLLVSLVIKMTFTRWLEYFLLNFSAACAIALDACLLVVLKFKDFSRPTDALKWAGAVGLTHVLFPMIGFVGGWILIERFHFAVAIYALGAVLLAVLLCIIVREGIQLTAEAQDKTVAGRQVFAFWIPVFYVSLDALLSGPGKTVLIDRYPKNLAVLSFFLVGSFVAFLTLLAGLVSRRMHIKWVAHRLTTITGLAKAVSFGIVGEIVLFSFFLTWCIADALVNYPQPQHFEIPFPFILTAGLFVGGTVSAIFFRQIFIAQLAKASALLNNTHRFAETLD
ncbi:MAG: mntP [Acidobacteria bacterium]|nr:mntP [Acidobacteriota bacterium]